MEVGAKSCRRSTPVGCSPSRGARIASKSAVSSSGIMRDADDLLASCFEVITTTGKYFWIPPERVLLMEFHPAKRPRDLFWRRATMMVAAMRGPATVGDLMALGGGRGNPAELVSILVGSLQCQIALRSDGEQPDSANRLNRVFGSRVHSIVDPKTSGGLASWRLGTGLTAPPLVQFIAARLLSGEREDNADAWIKALSADVVPEKHDTVRDVVRTAVEKRLPILRQLRIVPD